MPIKTSKAQKFVWIDAKKKSHKQYKFDGFPENIWSEFVSCSKGRWSSFADNKFLNFYNKYHFDHSLYDTDEINNLQNATNYYLKENHFSESSLKKILI